MFGRQQDRTRGLPVEAVRPQCSKKTPGRMAPACVFRQASMPDALPCQYVMRTPSSTLRPGSGATDEMNEAWL